MSSLPSNMFRRLLAPRPARGRKTTKPDYRKRLQILSLEDRVTPATFTVSNDADSGAGSLRQAILDANGSAGADDIVFDAGFFATDGVIGLTSGTLTVTEALSINNPAGAAAVTVARQSGTFGLFSAAANLTIDGLTITGGNAGLASGIDVTAAAASLTVMNSVISGNSGATRGAAISIPGSSTGLLTVQGSTISGNSGDTGGIYFFGGGSLLIQNSTISNNVGASTGTFDAGGLVFFGTVGAGGFVIENSTFHGNTTQSATGGGGISIRSATGVATIRNSTITGNSAPATATGGGGLGFVTGALTLTLTSNIIAENTGPTASPDLRHTSGTINATANLIGVVPEVTAGVFNDLGGNQTGSTGTPLSPVLSSLGNFGGPTQTRVPQPGSPALDVGDNTFGLLFDQRGEARENPAAAPDIGAVERSAIDAAPFASGSAPNVTGPGATTHTITVTYQDNDGTMPGLDITSILNNDNAVRVTGPGGYDVQAFFLFADLGTDGSPRVATYVITPPGGSWDGADNGAYTIQMQAGQVFDLDGIPVAAGAIGGFTVLSPLALTVLNANDSGPGSLRDAIAQTNASPSNDSITFDPGFFSTPQTIPLDSGLSISGGSLTIVNSTGADNVTVALNSGTFGIFSVASSSPNVLFDGLTITGGNAGSGGAITSNAVSNISVVNSVITGNTGALGGGIAVPAPGTGMITVQNSTISGNTGGTGGIYFFSGGSLLVQDSTISGNTGVGTNNYNAGGIIFYGSVGAGGFSIVNSTIHGNTSASANVGGGGIGFNYAFGNATITNSTITGNMAAAGGGAAGVSLYDSLGLTLTILSSVIAENTGPTDPDLSSDGSPLTATRSFVGVLPGANFNGPDTLSGNPNLGPLQNNGGSTETRAPNPGSPLLDAGDSSGLIFDQRGFGFLRSFNGAADIGAFEEQPIGTPFALPTTSNIIVSNVGETSYTFTVLLADPTGTNNGIDVSSVIGNNSALQIIGTNGFSSLATFVSIDNPTDGTPRTATYSFTPPGGSWDITDNSFYSIEVLPNQILDLDGTPITAGVLDTFSVSITPITVSNNNDSGGGSLREAILLANETPTDDQIIFDPGFFNTAQTITLLSGLPTISASGGALSIVGPGVNLLTVDAAGSGRVFNSLAPNLSMSGFTVTGGLASGGMGGGLQATGIVTLDHMVFEGNTATHGGNVGFSFGGGGGVAIISGGFLTLTNSTLANNTAERAGGGLYMRTVGGLVVQNSTISGNETTLVSGAYPYYGLYGGAGISLNGTASYTPPAGFTPGTVVIVNSTIAENLTTGSGGGIGFVNFFGNLLVQNSTISGNDSVATGTGAFGAYYPYGGGGIGRQLSFGGIDIQNSVVSGNTNGDFPDIAESYYSYYFGLVAINSSAIGDVTGLTYYGANNLIGQTLLLSGLGDNGGPTQTMVPLAGSPLIDAGDDGLVPVGTLTDQLGGSHDRIFGAAVDIGAFEVQPPEVTIEQGANQGDPTNSPSIVFDIVFETAVTGFDETDIVLSGTNTGTLVPVITGTGANYTLTVTGMVGVGTVVADILANAGTDASGQLSLASTSNDNSVLFDGIVPDVTIEQGVGQLDPTIVSPIVFDVQFTEDVVDFDGTDIVFSGSFSGTPVATVTPLGGGAYTVSVAGMTGEGTLIASIPAGAATDAAGNSSTASTSVDNSVSYDFIAPTVTIDQASTQADPAGGTTVAFDVVFSEPVVGFDGSQIDFTGSTATGSFTTTVSGSGPAYVVTVSGFTAGGTVVANIPAAVVTDIAGNPNTAATFTDNEVTFALSGTVQFSDPTYSVTEMGNPVAMIEVTRVGGSEGAIDVDYATVAGGTATDGLDFTGVSGTLSWADGDTASKFIMVPILDDLLVETDETINLELSNVSVDGALGTQSTAVLTILDFEEGILSFDSAEYSGAEGGTVTITVTRTGGSDGIATVDFGFVFGTATAADIGTPSVASGTTLTFADGDSTPQTITIPINIDALSEGRETIDLSLANVSGATADIVNATLTIDPSNPIVVDATNKFTLKFEDTDNDRVTVKLSGKQGSLNVYMTDNVGPISIIEAVGTNALKLNSVVKVSVVKAKKGVNPNADGMIGIGEIVGSGLKSILAAKSDLTGRGVILTDWLGLLRVANVLNGADIITEGANSQKTAIRTGVIEDDTIIDVGSILKSLKATSIGDGSIAAPSIGTIFVRGNMSSDIDVSGDGVNHLKNKKSVGKITVRGIVEDVAINVKGNIGSVAVYDFIDSTLYGSYTGPMDGSGTFDLNTPSTIGSFRTAKNKKLGLTGLFQNSSVIATNIKGATLVDVIANNGGTEFGVFAQVSFKSVTSFIGGVKNRARNNVPFTQDDFSVQVVV